MNSTTTNGLAGRLDLGDQLFLPARQVDLGACGRLAALAARLAEREHDLVGSRHGTGGEATLDRYARATWASFDAMTDAQSGLPTDQLHRRGRRRLRGGTADDTLYGDAGDDRPRGAAGDDVLAGGPGRDDLDGGIGRDHLESGEGSDTCAGDPPGGC